MKLNYFSITFWFNIFENHNEILKELNEALNDEFKSFNVLNSSNNFLTPIVTAVNNSKMTNLSFSKINLQYNMDKVTLETLKEFQEKSLKIFEFLTTNNIEVLHSAILINGEKVVDNAAEVISKNTISSKFIDDNFVDLNLKIGKKHEDLFYKIVSLLNKKAIKLPEKFDEQGRLIPIPLISWQGSLVENEIIEFSYEINDKYSFDFTKNYHTTEFYLNKMLYILENNFQDDLKNIIVNGRF